MVDLIAEIRIKKKIETQIMVFTNTKKEASEFSKELDNHEILAGKVRFGFISGEIKLQKERI